jgi:hypothetical protein
MRVKKLLGRFGGGQSKITSYFGKGGVLENSGMEQGPLQHTTVLRDNKRKAESDDRGSVGSVVVYCNDGYRLGIMPGDEAWYIGSTVIVLYHLI